jgi:hypothetical protein
LVVPIALVLDVDTAAISVGGRRAKRGVDGLAGALREVALVVKTGATKGAAGFAPTVRGRPVDPASARVGVEKVAAKTGDAGAVEGDELERLDRFDRFGRLSRWWRGPTQNERILQKLRRKLSE